MCFYRPIRPDTRSHYWSVHYIYYTYYTLIDFNKEYIAYPKDGSTTMSHDVVIRVLQPPREES